MKKYARCGTLAAVLAALLVACGGGGGGGGIAGDIPGGGGGGIGGTGASISGTINGFGSIFVNGIEFETDDASISVDGDDSTESALGLGMVVLVTGTVNEDGVTGTADSVIFDDDVQGPIQAIETSADGDSKTLTVLGVIVMVDRTGTVFDDVSFDTLALDDLVEVSGFFDGSGGLRATRVEKKSDFQPGSSEVELKGIVENLTGEQFDLGSFTVDYAGADLDDVPGGTLQEGMQVEVKGTLEGTLITASRIEEEDDLGGGFDEDEEISLEGIITDYVSDANFLINGIAVNASDAEFRPSGLVLENGLKVEAEGIWNGSVLLADELESRQANVKIDATIASVDTGAQSVTLQFFDGTVEVQVNSQTQLEDDTGIADPLTLGDLAGGNFLELEAVSSGSDLLATSIRRDEVDDDIIEAPVDSFVSGTSLTLLGITYSTAGAEFEDADDNSISSTDFYNQVEEGRLVKVKDEETPDGIADEVEFED